jgi:flavin reductase (DIM6/NTAB) family NADH-FMN oxidoreductase RutF
MERIHVPYDHQLSRTLSLLVRPGLLLVSTKPSGASNVMTIGWATIGVLWGKPVFVSLVRPSRYTYEFIEESHLFSVNVPTEEMSHAAGLCGSRSGRALDKFAAARLTISMGQTAPVATIDECPLVYECRVVHTNDVLPANLDPAIEAHAYAGSDYHRMYYGEITGTFAYAAY